MGKKDGNQDETPIRFEIPMGRKSGGAPIPINQPHWKYGSRRRLYKPGVFDWIVVISFLILSLSILAFGILNFNLLSLIVFLGILMTAGSFLCLYIIIIYDKEYKLRQEAEMKAGTKKTKKARRPKRRKDFK
jgi:hypothetical protein